ncbi:MAG: porphobilinogen synthase [bacterium]|nr:porphobilinogen synthase [bacterium]MDT8396397.1 porphobilinogen synthase [bacterium]
MQYPIYRPRRTRRTQTLRRMVRETRLSPDNFIYPLFVVHGEGVRKEIGAMPGVFQLSVDEIVRECRECWGLGVPAVILFGIPDHKDESGSEGWDPEGSVQKAVRAIKAEIPEMVVITDVCLCEYTSHGHCGLIENGEVLNDPTLELLARTALSHAVAGADIVGPSDMMDGRVAAIRDLLDDEGHSDTIIMSYAVKYASAFYGPFREAAESTPRFGDRRAYQMDPPNAVEAIREAALDVEEGADIIMVKPALPYLDIIASLRDRFDMPLAAYNVSGEYSMVKAGAKMGWIDGERVMMESLISIRRAGAGMILTYFAKEAARLLG